MQPFILSAALSFLIYEILVYVDVPPRRSWFRVGNVNVTFDERSQKWARRLLKVLFTLAIVFGILFLHEVIAPFDQITRDKTNIVLGFLFGPLFAIWLNAVFNHPPEKPLTRGLALGGIGLILFCLIGSAGNQTSRLIEQLTRKISGFKGFGVELSLSEPARKRDPSQGALPLSGSTGGSNFESNSGSAGISYASQLVEIVRRDRSYLTDLFGETSPQLLTQLDRAESLANLAVAPPMQCLSGWLEATADAVYVNSMLAPFVTAFRQVTTIETEEQRKRLSRMFIGHFARIASNIESFGPSPDVEAACLPLLKLICPDSVDKDNSMHVDNRADLMVCLGRASREHGPEGKAEEDAIAALSVKLSDFASDNALETRPYFAIAHASLLAQLGQYAAAAAVFDDWLTKQQKRAGSAPNKVERWFEIRMRSMFAAYFEEWLLKLSNSTPTAYRNEHLRNMDLLRGSLRDILSASSTLLKETGGGLKQPGPCTSSDKNLLLLRRLLGTYVTTELTHIQNRLHHWEYPKYYLETTDTDIERLARLDLSCLPSAPQAPSLVYAQILDAYALNAVQYVKTKKDTLDSQEKSARIKRATSALAYALEVTAKPAQDDLSTRTGPFLRRVSPSDWVSASESLKQTRTQLEGLSNDE
ncbi:hypothetical protein [Bradyrhizobium liaoningense]|uniref:hypothetical protein n=1 Tax=Bradyrhizobium liaoningense TaxID=43992 RepID=UPI001BA7E54C|nr:hypothetical protein [Bradyrhizobium liaoningense]MBR1171760.1 hypothetical protein [Bradyrhizobium liaoningense]